MPSTYNQLVLHASKKLKRPYEEIRPIIGAMVESIMEMLGDGNEVIIPSFCKLSLRPISEGRRALHGNMGLKIREEKSGPRCRVRCKVFKGAEATINKHLALDEEIVDLLSLSRDHT